MEQQPQPNNGNRSWTSAEDKRLFELYVIEGRTWVEIGEELNRSSNAVQNRYRKNRMEEEESSQDWTAFMDEQIINGRRCRMTTLQISKGMGLAKEAVQGRWQELRRMNKVPEDVLAIYKPEPKAPVEWSEEEDEAILGPYFDLKDIDYIAKHVKLDGRSQTKVRARFRELLKGGSPVYGRLMSATAIKPKQTSKTVCRVVKSG